MSNISDVLNKFSQKLSRFEKDDDAVYVRNENSDSALQKKINNIENDKESRVLAEFEKYKAAVSKEIEDDENQILSALKLYKLCCEAEKGIQKEVSKSLSINKLNFKSEICKKEDYVSGGKLIYLICWLYFVQNEKEFVPQIIKNSEGERNLEFVPFENYNFNYEEKAVFGIIQKSDGKN